MNSTRKTTPNISDSYEKLQSDTRGFLLLASLLKRHSGIFISDSDKNRSLMASRLASVLSDYHLTDYKDMHASIEAGNREILTALIEAMTTNKTNFFRERQHLDLFAKFIPELVEENKKSGCRDLRVWCAAASTGQEAYSMAMLLKEHVPLGAGFDVKFLATDIDRTVLQRATGGRYTSIEMEGLTPLQIQKYFHRERADDGIFEVNEDLRAMIRFAQFNLMVDPYPFEHKFDAIFCRNVLIYFDSDTAAEVMKKLTKSLRVGGLLFNGHTETGVRRPDNLTRVAVAVYRKTETSDGTH